MTGVLDMPAFAWLAAGLAGAALQCTVVAAALLLAERALSRASSATRSALVLLALAKFAVPAWVAWPLVPSSSRIVDAGSRLDLALAVGLALWVFGSFVALARWLGARVRLGRELAEAEVCEVGEAREALGRAARRAGLTVVPELLVSSRVATPFAAGILRPRIVLPAGWSERLSREDLETVLLHESMHVRRGDVLRLELAALLATVWWWNPVFHRAHARWRTHLEDACDDRTVAAASADPADYCRALLGAARLAAGSRLPEAAGVAAMSRHDFERRLRRMMAEHRSPAARTSRIGRALILAAGLLLLPMLGSARPASEPRPPGAHRHDHDGRHHARHGAAHSRPVHVHTIPIAP